MPTLTEYPFSQAYDIPSLTSQIQASSIVTVLDHIDVTGTVTDVWFKDALSSADQTTLNTVVTNYTYVPPAAPAPAKVIQVLGSDSLALCPFGGIISPAAGTLTNCDIVLPTSFTLRGAQLFSPNAALGDWVAVSVIDKDNVTGQGGTSGSPTMLGTYAISYYIAAGIWNTVEDISISQTLPAGVYMRFAYTSIGTTPPTSIVNFLSYVGTP